MKKVLTLVSALSMVAGSAFAHDYAWSVDKIPSTDKGVVLNTKGLLKYDGKKFTFNAEAGDFVTVLVNNSDATSDMTVIICGVKNTVEKGASVTLTQTVNAGDVDIEVTGSGYVAEIKVASAAGKRVEGYIKEAQAALNEANKETAAYAGGDLDPFFTAVRSQLNAQGVEIEKKNVVLRELLASNDAYAVSTKENDIKKALLDLSDVNSVVSKITNIKDNAKAAKRTLDNILGSPNATAALDAIKKAKATSLVNPSFLHAYKADGTTVATKLSDVKVIKGNDSDDAKPYIYNFTPTEIKNGKVTWGKPKVGGLKRDWVETEIAAIEKEYSGVKTAIIAKMAKEFEETANSFQAAGNSESDLSALYDAVKSSVGYMTERIHVEVHHAAHISELASDVTTLDGVIGDFGYPTTEAEYNTWKTDVNDLKGAIADATTRHSANSVNTLNADKTVKGLIATTCDNAQATQATYREKILTTAYGKVKAEFDKVQNKLNEYSYKISAKYQNEKDIQQVYEKKFAELQNSLNTIEGLYQGKPGTIVTDMSAAWNYMVTKYADRLSELNSKSKALDDMWGETIQKQQQQVIDDNNKALNTLTAQIKGVRDYYDVQVAKIAGYREFVPSSSATEAINTSLKELFNIVLGLEAKQDEINKKVEKCNTASKNATDVEFNADSDQYRFKSVTTDSNGQNVSYEKAVDDIKTAIEDQVKVAIGKANEATLKYIYLSQNSYINGTEKYASVQGLRSLISNKQLLKNDEYVDREMSTAAASAFKNEYAHVDWNKVPEKQSDGTTKDVQKGYIALAEEMIMPLLKNVTFSEAEKKLVVTSKTKCIDADAAIPAAGKVAANLVDQIASIKSLYLDPAKKAIDDIDTELVSYEGQYKKIGELKIKWTVDKANLDELAKKASAADPSMTKANFEGELNAINTEIKSISAQLEANATSATKVAEKTAETLKAQGIALAKLEKYDVWFANKQAKTEADKLYAEVAKNLQGAKDALAKMNENVQAKYGPAFDQNTTDLENAKVTLDKAVVDDLDATTANIAAAKGVLETIKNEIAATLKAAEEANKTDESLDYNKDGEINDKDHLAAQDDTTNGVITLDTYYDWVNKFVDYQTNSK